MYWCWLQESICSCADIVPSDDTEEANATLNVMALYRTVSALVQHADQLDKKKEQENEPATNTNETDEEDSFLTDIKKVRQAPNTLDLSNLPRKRKYPSTKFHMMQATTTNPKKDILNEIIEECEYDSDIGKFKCKDDDVSGVDDSETSSTASIDVLTLNTLNDLNSPLKCVNKNVMETQNIVVNAELDLVDTDNMLEKDEDTDVPDSPQSDQEQEVNYKIVMKRIEYFESAKNLTLCQEKLNNNPVESDNNKIRNCEKVENTVNGGVKPEGSANTGDSLKKKDSTMPTILFSIFVTVVAMLIIFPRPN